MSKINLKNTVNLVFSQKTKKNIKKLKFHFRPKNVTVLDGDTLFLDSDTEF